MSLSPLPAPTRLRTALLVAAHGASASPTAGGRVRWVDAAKGLAILLVVLFHAGKVLEDAGVIGGTWLTVNDVVSTFRMPLFFAASGLFLGSVVQRPWADLWRTRLRLLLWVFVVWTLLRFGYFSAFPSASRPEETDPARLVQALWAPPTGLWFLYALVVFTLIARATRWLPAWAVVAPAALASAVVLGPVALPYETWDRLAVHLVFFLAAARWSAPLRGWVAEASGAALGWSTLAFAVLAAAAAIGLGSWLALPAGVAAVLSGFLAARRTEGTGVGAVLVWIGERTLPIYVAHVLVLCFLAERLVERGYVAAGTTAEVWLPLGLSAVAVAASLVSWEAARRTPLRALYAPPAARPRS